MSVAARWRLRLEHEGVRQKSVISSGALRLKNGNDYMSRRQRVKRYLREPQR